MLHKLLGGSVDMSQRCASDINSRESHLLLAQPLKLFTRSFSICQESMSFFLVLQTPLSYRNVLNLIGNKTLLETDQHSWMPQNSLLEAKKSQGGWEEGILVRGLVVFCFRIYTNLFALTAQTNVGIQN